MATDPNLIEQGDATTAVTPRWLWFQRAGDPEAHAFRSDAFGASVCGLRWSSLFDVVRGTHRCQTCRVGTHHEHSWVRRTIDDGSITVCSRCGREKA